jgi:hypothetical protein
MLITVGNTSSVHRRSFVGSNSGPNFDQVDPGSELFLVEITGDYHTPILTRRKSVSVPEGEQSCFTGGFG